MNKSGYSLIEMVLVMLLLIFVSFYVFTLTETGSTAYLRLTRRQQETADLRTGLSYLDVKLKSNDTDGLVTITADPFSGQPALLINQPIGDELYYTWIYVYDNTLYELFTREGAQVSPLMGNKIARAGQLELEMAGPQLLRVSLTGSDGPGAEVRTRLIRLCSAGGQE